MKITQEQVLRALKRTVDRIYYIDIATDSTFLLDNVAGFGCSPGYVAKYLTVELNKELERSDG